MTPVFRSPDEPGRPLVSAPSGVPYDTLVGDLE